MKGEAYGEWTLTEAARVLGEPQHRLIYLCEKGVIQPDFQGAKGRGSSRRYGETADLARAEGNDPVGTAVVAGLRLWF